MEPTVKSNYSVFEKTADGQFIWIREVLGALTRRDHHWELLTKDGVIHGTLEGDPGSVHVFTDESGLEYRIT